MKSDKYLANKKAKKMREYQRLMVLAGLDPGPLYYSKYEMKDFMKKIDELPSSMDYRLEDKYSG
jgi:hypothetical protein